MKSCRLLLAVVAVGFVLFQADPGEAYVEALYTLPRVINESSNIVLVKVEKVNKERKLIYYKKIADLKGKHPGDFFKHNVGVGGFNAFEQKAPIEWAQEGKLAIIFHNGGASETCIGNYWYQCYAGGDWWNHSHGEPYMARTYSGDIDGLKVLVEKLLKGEEVLVPCAVSRTDRRIQKVKASMKDPLAYPVIEPPSITAVKLNAVAGFSAMLELPRPPGTQQGAIAVDFDNDGYMDILLVGTQGLVLLQNDRKGTFIDVTEKWGLGKDQGCRAAAFADYNKSGRLSLLTSTGKLYTNLGDKFRDDSDLLPKTPERVSNPSEAVGWADINGDGLPDVILSIGLEGLTAYLNKGAGKDGKWTFEDGSDKVGLGPSGIGVEPANYLTLLDLNGAGKTGFILNRTPPLIAHNNKGVFTEAKDTGLTFPGILRPSISPADYLNNGKLGLFVTCRERAGSLTNWQAIGPFSQDEDKALKAGPDFSPEKNGQIKIGEFRWSWSNVRARPTGNLEVRRTANELNAAYAFTTFDWPQAEKIALYVGSENGVTIWLNGKQIHAFNGKRPYAADSDRVEVDVVKGSNSLLLKVFDEGDVLRVGVRPAAIKLYPPAVVQLLVSDGKGKFQDVTADSGDLAQLRNDAVSAVWADLDNDGLLDLVVTCKTGLVRFYRNLGDGKFRYATADLGLEQKFKAASVVMADFNKDGKLDMLLLGEGEEPNVVLLSQIAGKLTPVSLNLVGGQSSIGARVQIADSTGKIIRSQSISGGDGRNMQSTPEVRFALPPGKYRVQIDYSSGAVVNRDLEVTGQPQWLTVDTTTGK